MFIGLYRLLWIVVLPILRLLSLWSAKVQTGLVERKQQHWNLGLTHPIHIHCASVGEYEMARPVLKLIRAHDPNVQILLTFFSPSGMRFAHRISDVDTIRYLPWDRQKDVRRFLDEVNPSLYIGVRYEIWPELFLQLQERGIPSILIDTSLRKTQAIFKWYGSGLRTALKRMTKIALIDQQMTVLAHAISLDNTVYAGDTKIANTLDRKSEPLEQHDDLIQWINQRPVFILGSFWAADAPVLEQTLQIALEHKWAVIIAPHEVEEDAIRVIRAWINKNLAADYQLFSEDSWAVSEVLLVDTIGHLSRLYRYATLAYIGGGFGRGIHNILEACAGGCLVTFGPKYEKFMEAQVLISRKGIIPIQNEREMLHWFQSRMVLLSTSEEHEIIENYFEEHKNAPDRVFSLIQNLLDESSK